ncbi:hypothetical protein BJ741DRAFT_233991 [Chytriomyces cf. hyalinus JEL632]|nr:hypothetical protein BJ741DRAFT_233991 [Chytriomyces cf. hyalinus JEL632]
MNALAFATFGISDDNIPYYQLICAAYWTMMGLSLLLLLFLCHFLPYEIRCANHPVTATSLATPFNILIIASIIGNMGLFACHSFKWYTNTMPMFILLNSVSGIFSAMTFISAVLYTWLRAKTVVEIVNPSLTPILRILGTILYPLLIVSVAVIDLIAIATDSYKQLATVEMILGMINGVILVLFDAFTLGVYIVYLKRTSRDKPDLDISRLLVICRYGSGVCCLLLVGTVLFVVGSSFGLGFLFDLFYLGMHACAFLGTLVLCGMKVALHREKVAEKERKVLQSTEAKGKANIPMGVADGNSRMESFISATKVIVGPVT